jgi:mxaJ protein
MRSRFPERPVGPVIAGAALFVIACAGGGARTHAVPARTLRVCADPNNLPFSNARGEGFENKIAELVAGDRGASLSYTWWAQRRGFFRSTLDEDRCDVVLGVPSTFERVLATRPYYRSSYVFLSRRDRGLHVRSFDDPVLRRLRVGVQIVGADYANAPPAHALSRRGIVANVVGFDVYGDYSQESPPARIVTAVAKGDVDLAVVWGPLAGYFGRRQPVPLEMAAVSPVRDGVLPFAFDISLGVRRGNKALREELDDVLRRRRTDIDAILDDYGVPRIGGPGES